MKNIERIYLIVIFFLVILRLYQIPTSGGFLTISILTFSLFYMFLSAFLFNNISLDDINRGFNNKGISRNRIIFSIFTGISLSIILIGLLFKIMLWPGAAGMFYLGTRLIFVPLVISIIKYFPSKETFYLNALKRTTVAFIISIVSLNLSNDYLYNIYYKDFPEYIEAIKKARKNPNDLELEENERKERENMIKKRRNKKHQSE